MEIKILFSLFFEGSGVVCQSSTVRRSYKDMEPWVHPAPCPISLLMWGGQRCPQEHIVGDPAPQRAAPRPVLLLPGARSSPSPSARPFLASCHGRSSRVGRPGLLRASEDRNGLQRVARQKFENVGSLEVSAWRGTAPPPTLPSAPHFPCLLTAETEGCPRPARDAECLGPADGV